LALPGFMGVGTGAGRCLPAVGNYYPRWLRGYDIIKKSYGEMKKNFKIFDLIKILIKKRAAAK
jgi:hypothetical protein